MPSACWRVERCIAAVLAQGGCFGGWLSGLFVDPLLLCVLMCGSLDSSAVGVFCCPVQQHICQSPMSDTD